MSEIEPLEKDKRGPPELGEMTDPGSFPNLHKFAEWLDEKFMSLLGVDDN